MNETYITASEVAVLNAARLTLKAVSRRCAPMREQDGPENVPYDGGRLAEAADSAEHLVFNVLNTANAHYNSELTQAQLHEDAR